MYVCKSKMSDKSRINTQLKIKNQICAIQKNITSKEVRKLNSIILGSHNYFKIASHVNKDFGKIFHCILKTLKNRFRLIATEKLNMTLTFEKFYGDYKNNRYFTICNISIFPIYGVKCEPAMSFNQSICNYTEEGRNAINQQLNNISSKIIRYLLDNSNENNSTEYNDNRISSIIGQRGKCYVTGEYLKIGEMECHHKLMKSDEGSDNYKNLAWVSSDIHKLIHATNTDTIERYIKKVALNKEGLKRLNSLRKQVGNLIIN